MLGKISERQGGISTECDNVPFSFCLVENENLGANTCNKDEFVRAASSSCAKEQILERSIFSNFISSITERLAGVVEVFSPVLSFIRGVFESGNGLVPGTNRQLIESLSSLLQSTEENVNKKHLMSDESMKALRELTSVVSQLKQNNNNVDLGRIISDWRNTRDGQHLLYMAEHLESGGCQSLNGSELKELRESFIRGLRTLAKAIQNAEERGEFNALDHLHRAADPLVCGVERAHEACKRENPILLCEDKRFIGERLRESCDCIDEGFKTGVFNGLDSSVTCELHNWTTCTYDFLKEFFEMLEQEEKEKEEAERKEQCKVRCEQEEEREYLHVLHRRAESEKLYLRTLMKRAEMELLFAKMRANAAIEAAILSGKKRIFCSENFRNEKSKCNILEALYQAQANKEFLFIEQEIDIEASMPPASVCDHEMNSLGFNFDAHC